MTEEALVIQINTRFVISWYIKMKKNSHKWKKRLAIKEVRNPPAHPVPGNQDGPVWLENICACPHPTH